MMDEILDNADDFEPADLPPLPDAAADDDPASPFSVALGTVAGMTGVRALRKAWQRHRDEGDDSAAAPAAEQPSGEQPPREPGSVRAEPETSRLAEERAALVELCIELDDMITSDALRAKLRRGLRRVGVEALEPEGVRFDPEVHRAVGSAVAPDAERELTIASVERPGFRDGGVEVRPPEVIVYSSGESARDD
jgi:molecular chaperone GrpE